MEPVSAVIKQTNKNWTSEDVWNTDKEKMLEYWFPEHLRGQEPPAAWSHLCRDWRSEPKGRTERLLADWLPGGEGEQPQMPTTAQEGHSGEELADCNNGDAQLS